MGNATVRGAARAIWALKAYDTATLVLIAMSVEVKDRGGRDEVGLYYAGWTHLAASLGEVPSDPMRRRISRALAWLIEAGLIERVKGPGPGSPAVYRLLITPVDSRGRSVETPQERGTRWASHDSG